MDHDQGPIPRLLTCRNSFNGLYTINEVHLHRDIYYGITRTPTVHGYVIIGSISEFMDTWI